MRALASLLLVVVLAGWSWGAAPPARLTAAQREQLAQSRRWLQQANNHFRAGEIDQALAAVHKALALERAVYGHLQATSLPSLEAEARLLEQRERFTEAIAARQELLQRRQELHGPGDWRVTDACLDLQDTRLLARLDARQRQQLRQALLWNAQVVRLWKQGRSRESLPLAEKALQARRAVLGEKHRLTALSWFNLGAQRMALHHVEAARRCYEQALQVLQVALGEKHPTCAQCRSNLAGLYKDLGEYKKALLLYRQALQVNQATQGDKHPTSASILNNLAVLYLALGDYQAALPLCQQALEIFKVALGTKHPDYASSLNSLAMLYRAMGDHKAALPLFRQAVVIRKEVLGQKHPDYALSLNNLASLLQAMGDYQGALPLYRQALEVRKEVLGEKHPSYAQSLNNLAYLYQAMGDYQAALPLFRQALQARKEAQGTRHPDYAVSLNNLAALYKDMGDQKNALPLYRQALAIHKEVLGQKHPLYPTSLNNLAMLYLTTGDHRAALPLLQQALAIRKEVLGQKHPDYALSLNSLASLLQAMGDYKAALPLCQQALQVRKAALGEKHPDYAQSLINLSNLYREMGDHRAALPLFQQARQIYKEALGQKHPEYAVSLNNLALLYRDMGDHRAALPLFLHALQIRKAALGEKHPSYAIGLNNLALLYQDMGDHKAALPLYQQALQIRKEAPGQKHPLYALSLNNLGRLFLDMGDHKAALPLFQQALQVYKEGLGEKHPLYALSLNSLASLYQLMGDHKAALPLYQQALQIHKEALGQKHPRYASSLHNLAALSQGMKQGQEATHLCEQSLAITRANLLVSASVQSERQQLAAARAVRYQLDLRLSLPDSPKDGAAASYQHVLTWKGAVFGQQRQRRQFARLLVGSGPEVRSLVEQLQQTTRLLAAITLAPVDARLTAGRRQQAEQFTQQKEDLESRLSRLSTAFRDQQKQADLTSAQVQQTLPADTALVDFLFYIHHDHTPTERGKRYQRRLAAWVVRRGQPVLRVNLGPAEPIEQAAAAWRQALIRRGGAGDAARKLHRLLWQPLAKSLSGANTVLISPDGVLGTVPFAALPGSKKGTYLIEDVAIAVAPVPQLLPQVLAAVPKEKRLKPSLLVIGDVNFDSTQTAVASADDRGAPRGGPNGWGKLEGTSAEADAVRGSFSRLFKGGAVTDLREEQARKAAVRQALQKSRYAHLATHGFFAPAELKSALAGQGPGSAAGLFGQEGVTGWHPLLLSGLVLAGANKEAKPGEEDGILTALEVSEMDLAGLELAVLSACETGLGRQAGGEGLLGLQRAFAVAGCRSVIASLWKVDDRATQALMAAFYRVWWGKKIVSRVEALRQAQLSLLKEGVRSMVREPLPAAKKDDRLPPYYWAAFVLSGDWR
jgi:tetratricopeptide (TPR) repeat protein